MIDIHCHILPHVDDGAKNMEEALAMAKIACQDGVTTIVATPHFIDGSCYVTGVDLIEHFEEFKRELHKEKIPVEVVLGNEAYLTPDLPRYIRENKVFTVNHSRYILVEFPMNDIPLYVENVMYELMLEGLVPVIAHPERYTKIIEQPALLYQLVKQGALVQMNAGSITGRFGTPIQEISRKLLKNNLVHFIGSDGHSPRSRKPVLSEAVLAVSEMIGKEKAVQLVQHNPYVMVNNQDIYVPEPTQPTNDSLFQKIIQVFMPKQLREVK